MRVGVLLFALATVQLSAPQSISAQGAAGVERFNVSGLPKEPQSAREKEIFLLLRVHRKGDLADATRIHMMLAEYYKGIGDKARADDCTKAAEKAWKAASSGDEVLARAPGTPPFEPAGTFDGKFENTDELRVVHRWQFFTDGTFSHSVSDAKNPNAEGPVELGWYSVQAGQLRLWQLQPPVDRTLPFELLGAGGKDGAMLDGVRLKVTK